MVEFSPRTVASFSLPQLHGIIDWAAAVGVNTNDGFAFNREFRELIAASRIDERGKILDEKGRRRLQIAGRLIVKVVNDKDNKFGRVDGPMSVWQISENPDDLQLRWYETFSQKLRLADEKKAKL